MVAESPVTELSVRQSLEFLAGETFGRLATVLNGKPDIFPINFVVDVTNDDKAVVYIRTSPGNKLFAAVSGFPVALEADDVEESSATSVVIYGRGRLVQHRHEFERVEALGVEAQIAARKPEVLAIDVDHISGRQFVLGPAPAGVETDPTD